MELAKDKANRNEEISREVDQSLNTIKEQIGHISSMSLSVKEIGEVVQKLDGNALQLGKATSKFIVSSYVIKFYSIWVASVRR